MILPVATLLLQISAIAVKPSLAVSGTEAARTILLDTDAKPEADAARSSGRTAPAAAPSASPSGVSADSRPASELADSEAFTAPTPLPLQLSFSGFLLGTRSYNHKHRDCNAL